VGGRTLRQVRESNAQSGFRSQSASTFLFAIPPGHRVREAEVRWPDGRVQRVKQIKPGERTTLSSS
jgi:hypothetical protein